MKEIKAKVLRIPISLEKQLKEKAELKGINLNSFIVAILWDYIENNKN